MLLTNETNAIIAAVAAFVAFRVVAIASALAHDVTIRRI